MVINMSASGEECDITFVKGMSKMTDYENGVQ
jgi:hypothetical protein